MLLAAFEHKVYLFVDWSLLEILVKRERGGEASTLLPFKFCYMLHKQPTINLKFVLSKNDAS